MVWRHIPKGEGRILLGMNGQDIYFIVDGKMSLVDAINLKARYAAETGEIFYFGL